MGRPPQPPVVPAGPQAARPSQRRRALHRPAGDEAPTAASRSPCPRPGATDPTIPSGARSSTTRTATSASPRCSPTAATPTRSPKTSCNSPTSSPASFAARSCGPTATATPRRTGPSTGWGDLSTRSGRRARTGRRSRARPQRRPRRPCTASQTGVGMKADGVRVVVPAAAGSSPVAHPPKALQTGAFARRAQLPTRRPGQIRGQMRAQPPHLRRMPTPTYPVPGAVANASSPSPSRRSTRSSSRSSGDWSTPPGLWPKTRAGSPGCSSCATSPTATEPGEPG